MKRSVTFLIALLAVVVSVPVFAAGNTATATINVSANVSSVCTISALPVAFGAYDPVGTNAVADLYANGSVTVACTKGAPGVWIDLNAGTHAANAVGTTRAMASALPDYLSYELYKANPNPVAGAIWSTGNGTGGVTYVSASKAPTTITVFGRVPGGQDVTAGGYTDQVTATINY